jgi:hypothetical protein
MGHHDNVTKVATSPKKHPLDPPRFPLRPDKPGDRLSPEPPGLCLHWAGALLRRPSYRAERAAWPLTHNPISTCAQDQSRPRLPRFVLGRGASSPIAQGDKDCYPFPSPFPRAPKNYSRTPAISSRWIRVGVRYPFLKARCGAGPENPLPGGSEAPRVPGRGGCQISGRHDLSRESPGTHRGGCRAGPVPAVKAETVAFEPTSTFRRGAPQPQVPIEQHSRLPMRDTINIRDNRPAQ